MVDLGCVFASFFAGTIVGLTRVVGALIGTRAALTAVDGPLMAKLLATISERRFSKPLP